MGILYVVSTPIGNLDDLTERAREVLSSVDRVLAEDTRRTRILLDHLGVEVPLVSLHQHNEAAREGTVLDWLGAGESLALVSDAGTPLVSDPGARLVRAVLEAGHTLVPIPGPSAVLAALAGSGMDASRFLFLGFPPRKGRERTRLLERVAVAEEPVVLFESPPRLLDLLRTLENAVGPHRPVAVARELTKVHETFFRGTLAEAVRYYQAHPPRGEITLVVGAPARDVEREESDASDELGVLVASVLLHHGIRPSEVARTITERLGLPRNRAYELVQGVDRRSDAERAGRDTPGRIGEGDDGTR